MNLHDYLKLCKHGYSKVTDHACREIRHKRISRDQGIFLIKNYEKKDVEYLELFCKWLGIDNEALTFVLNRSRNKNFWEETDVNKFKFKGLSTFFNSKDEHENIKASLNHYFKPNSNINLSKKTEYITFGKGWEN